MKCSSIIVLLISAFLSGIVQSFTDISHIQFQVSKEVDKRLTEFRKFLDSFSYDFRNETDVLFRFDIFKKNMEIIEKAHLNCPDAKFEANRFAIMTDDERKKFVMPRIPFDGNFNDRQHQGVPVWLKSRSVRSSLPTYVNWVERGHVTPVKNQGSCGSCYAFASIAALESAYSIKGSGTLSLSEQQIVDCDSYTGGCGGGWMTQVYRYLQESNSESAQNYPYRGYKGTCAYSRASATQQVIGYKQLPTENDIREWVATQGPAAIAMFVSSEFYYVKSGIFTPPTGTCTSNNNVGGHAMAVVGYGTENGRDYWLIKNSWGSTWGADGYFKMARGSNACEIESYGRWGNSGPYV